MNFGEFIHGVDDALAHGRAVLRTPAIAIDLKLFAVMQLKQLHRKQGHRVQAEVARGIADADFAVAVSIWVAQLRYVRVQLVLDIAARGSELLLGIIRNAARRAAGFSEAELAALPL